MPGKESPWLKVRVRAYMYGGFVLANSGGPQFTLGGSFLAGIVDETLGVRSIFEGVRQAAFLVH